MPAVYDPTVPEVRANPYPVYRAVREADPVQFDPRGRLWSVTRHADCLSVLRDRRFSSSLAHRIRMRDDELPVSMLNTDPPDHARLRGPVARLLDRRRMERAREHVRGAAAEVAADLANAREADLMAAFARPLVTRVFVELLGIPAEEADSVSAWIRGASVILDPLAPPDLRVGGGEASGALASYLRGLISDRRRVPGDDLVSELAEAGPVAGLSEDELVSTCTLLAIGGHDPAVHLIGNGMLTLLRHPDQLHRVRDDLTRVPEAVEELLRFESPIQLAARVATVDVELGGKKVRRGQAVLVLIGAANRDPAVFPDPDRLDVRRSPNSHLAFGAGVHMCLGAMLTRTIGRAAVEAVLTAFPDAHLARESPVWSGSLVPRGLEALPVELW